MLVLQVRPHDARWRVFKVQLEVMPVRRTQLKLEFELDFEVSRITNTVNDDRLPSLTPSTSSTTDSNST